LFERLGLSLKVQSQLIKDESPSLSVIAQKMANSFSYFLSNFILVLVYMLLLLYYRKHLVTFILKLVGSERAEKAEKIIHQAAHVSQSYLVGLSKMIVCLWIMYAIGFSAFGIKNAIFFAILCGLLEIIPFIGNITGTALTLLMAAAQGAGVPILLGVLATYGTVQFIQGWILEPLIVGSQVKINPLFTIVSLVLGELLWGIPGIFLAIPLTAIVKTVCDQVEVLKPFGFLMGEVGQAREKKHLVNRLKKFLKHKDGL
jgi:predicted PurR-regulated permease PerM